MQVNKVSRYRTPSIPDKDAALQEPALLLATPERWKRNAAACTALAATTMLLASACATEAGTSGGVTTAQQTASPLPTATPTVSPSPSPSPAPTANAAIAVPLFEHGDGRGSFGCVSVAPPAFLNEWEAFEIINEITSKEGLRFLQSDLQLEKIDIPSTNIYGMDQAEPKLVNGSLLLDGVDREKKVAFEFVSTKDIENWQEKTNVWSSVSSYDFIGSAKALNGSINNAGTGMTVAVFYDPGINFEKGRPIIKESGDDFTSMAQKLKELVKEDLRKQVLDFIAWLKAQGIV